MLIHELSVSQCERLLERNQLARLACALSDQPYIVPISFTFAPQENCLYGFASVGQKIEWMRSNPKVCITVDEIIDRFHWTTVVVIGRYEEIAPQDVTARRRAQHLLQRRPQWWLPAAAESADEPQGGAVFFRIHIGDVTGRRAGSPDDPSATPHV
jgi:nitroimidazol reductase NimA-like FMN-containing flavoprotein (pyridoxamine 5'-phosphate oxidase superfamily)